jgi:hypothetical protein
VRHDAALYQPWQKRRIFFASAGAVAVIERKIVQ